MILYLFPNFSWIYCQASSSGAAAENGSLPDQVKNLKIEGDADLLEPVLELKSLPLDIPPSSANPHGEFSILQFHYDSLSCIAC